MVRCFMPIVSVPPAPGPSTALNSDAPLTDWRGANISAPLMRWRMETMPGERQPVAGDLGDVDVAELGPRSALRIAQ